MQRNVRDYAVVTASYWAFTLTDGALRMLVLLFLYELGYSPLQIASLFLFYEFFGIVTNLFGGYLGARFGLKSTLFSGLTLQIVALSMLGFGESLLTVPYVMAAQGLSGIAKDLTKMSSKSYIKLVVPEENATMLLRWVALLTGSKNTLKGAGFFLGGFLLTLFGFRDSVLAMAAMLALTMVISLAMLPGAAGKSEKSVTLGSVFAGNAKVKWLSLARFFLFGSRDVWFVLALPIFLAAVLGWNNTEVGGFLALWIVGYGIVQAIAPAYVGGSSRTGHAPPTSRALLFWTTLLILPLGAIVFSLFKGFDPATVVIVGLGVFGIVFATNSAIHSYLIVVYAEGDRVALSVGFYYMANAAGRLVGTVLSGSVFQIAGGGTGGLVACLWVAMGFVTLSTATNAVLRRSEGGRGKGDW